MLHEQVRFCSLVCSLEFPRRWPDFPEHQRELDFGVMELLGAVPLTQFSWNSGRLNDLDAVLADPVTWSHLCVHLFHSSIQCGITVLLVHVVIPRSTLIPQPNTIVLDLSWVLLKDLQRQTKNTSVNTKKSCHSKIEFHNGPHQGVWPTCPLLSPLVINTHPSSPRDIWVISP